MEFSIVMTGLLAPLARFVPIVALLAAGNAFAAEVPIRGELAGGIETYVTKDADTLLDLARQAEVGYVPLRAANPGVDPWLPGDGTVVTLPTEFILPTAERRGIVVNLAEQRLYYFRDGPGRVVTYPVGIPTWSDLIPRGTTRVVAKRPNPTWLPPPSLRAAEPGLPESVPPGPDNPLGAFAISLAWPSFVIHGTNKPDGVGRRVSHGCIRLYPENIEALYPTVPVGTPVTVVDQPVKVGWSDGALYLEVHPTQDEADEIEADGRIAAPAPLDAESLVRAKAGSRAGEVNWELVKRTVRERRGIPVRITLEPPTANAGSNID